jgi:hypothetical protein
LEPTTAPEPKLQIRRASIEGLRLDPSNARLHDEANLTAIRASLQRFGQVEPLLINSATKQIVAGHGRLQAMKALGWSECDVVELDLNSIDATALAVALNRSAELATWDEETLAKLLASLKSEDALDGVGFSDSELDELLAQFDEVPSARAHSRAASSGDRARADRDPPPVDDRHPCSWRGAAWRFPAPPRTRGLAMGHYGRGPWVLGTHDGRPFLRTARCTPSTLNGPSGPKKPLSTTHPH